MDPTTAVRTDTLPAIATVIAPGAVASGPCLWLSLSNSSDLQKFATDHEAISLSCALVLWIVTGFAIDSLGSYVEVYCIDRRRPDHKEMLETWWRYLRIAWAREPVGQHYLRRMLVTFKFELNMFVATFVSLLAVGALGMAGSMPWPAVLKTGLGFAAAALFFAKAARDSSEVLADVRTALVKGVGEPPFDASGDSGKSSA